MAIDGYSRSTTARPFANGLVHTIRLNLHERTLAFHVRGFQVLLLLPDACIDALQTLAMDCWSQLEKPWEEGKDDSDTDQQHGNQDFKPQIAPRFVGREDRDKDVHQKHETDDERGPAQPRTPIVGGS